ncbi:MAG: hypothetical protein EP333_03050 [Bacteroidetes bacterium]|nr:MAG: hypothetical protein EP333_03050 [Bacteroidota bacterium]
MIRNFRYSIYAMKIVIGGCGKLGSQIGKALVYEGHEVYGTWRSEESRDQIKELGIIPIEYHFSTVFSQLSQEITDKTDLVILSLPPIEKNEITSYGIALSNFISLFDDNVKLIFTSSIGVYPQKEGNYDETYVFNRDESLNSLYLAERAVLSVGRERSAVLRLGGLIGENRHPIFYMSGKVKPEDGTAPVNLIHHNDIVRFVQFLISDFRPGIYNLVFNIEQDKKTYYTEAALEFGLQAPTFGSSPDINRRVSGEMVVNKLGFNYLFSPQDWNTISK